MEIKFPQRMKRSILKACTQKLLTESKFEPERTNDWSFIIDRPSLAPTKCAFFFRICSCTQHRGRCTSDVSGVIEMSAEIAGGS